MNRVFMFSVMVAVACISYAEPAMMLKCDQRLDMRAASTRHDQYITFEEGGRTGKCFHLVCPKDFKEKKIGYHPWKQPMLKLESVSDKVRIRLDVKGSGTLYLGFLCFDKDKKIFYPPRTGFTFTLQKSDKWEQKEFVYTPQAGSLYTNRAGYVLPYISIQPGSDVLIDNFSAEFLGAGSGMVIEK